MPDPLRTRPELIVVTRPEIGALESAPGATPQDFSSLEQVLTTSGARMRSLFGGASEAPATIGPPLSPEAFEAATEGPSPAELSRFFVVEAPESEHETLVRKLNALPSVEAAYLKPPGEPPVMTAGAPFLNSMAPSAAMAPA